MRACYARAQPFLPCRMYSFFITSLRSIAAILVPCGIFATLVLPRAHAVGMGGELRHGERHPAMLLAEGLPFIIIRPSGRIAMVSRSARRLFALRPGVGGNLLSLTAGSDAQEALRRALASPYERTEYFRVAFPGTAGEERLYRMESTPMAEVDATGIVLRDITHRMEDEPASSDSRMAEAVSSMAGPLSVLSGWLETASEPGATLSPAALRAMERQVERLKALSAGWGAETAECPLLLGRFELAPEVQRAADRLAPRMVETGSRLELSYDETPFMLRGDRTMCRQLVGELLASTLSGQEARRLRLTATRHGQQVWVDIASDGPAAWEAEGNRSRLELVRAAVRAQNGELEDDASATHGTHYRLIFPA